MNKEYRQTVFKFMKSMGFHRKKSRPLARKLNRLADDLATFENPDIKDVVPLFFQGPVWKIKD